MKITYNLKNILKAIDKKAAILSVCCGLVFAAACSFSGFGSECEAISRSVLRMHIIANSDSSRDQELKLYVRDRLLQVSPEVFKGCGTESEAEAAARKNIELLQSTAEVAISEYGAEYPVSVTVGDAWFNNREYDGFTLPAGTYNAVRVVIGSGEGHNWWCVMFPAVCLPAAVDGDHDISSVLDDTQTEIVKNSNKYVAGFKVVEIYEELKNRISGWFGK